MNFLPRINQFIGKSLIVSLSRGHKRKGLRYLSSMVEHKTLIAIIQVNSSNDKIRNFETCKTQIENASRKGAKMIFLPEAFDFIGESVVETLAKAEALDGPLISKYMELAKYNGVWLSLGGFHEKLNEDKVYNTHVILNSLGKIVSTYRKVHLFHAVIPAENTDIQESKYTLPGPQITRPIVTPFGCLGLCICYDLRFPEISLTLKSMGANIILYPSAFTFRTGALHWEPLIKARAIENQCYAIAAAQTGMHGCGRFSWGHSMVVDPYGTIVAQCSTGEGYALAEIDISYCERFSTEIPVWKHKRYDLYPKMEPLVKSQFIDGKESIQDVFQFGQHFVKHSTVFYSTEFTIAFTNKRCIVPGHVLVSPKRVVPRLQDLTKDEICDLFQVVQKVETVVEKYYDCDSSTVSIQDGPNAGQTVQHVHVHVLPRRQGDLQRNDDIYNELEKHDKFNEKSVRLEDEMIAEAQMLRNQFSSLTHS